MCIKCGRCLDRVGVRCMRVSSAVGLSARLSLMLLTSHVAWCDMAPGVGQVASAHQGEQDT
eukprot:33582-Eustigmatos_ZCMA.PRE.1